MLFGNSGTSSANSAAQTFVHYMLTELSCRAIFMALVMSPSMQAEDGS